MIETVSGWQEFGLGSSLFTTIERVMKHKFKRFWNLFKVNMKATCVTKANASGSLQKLEYADMGFCEELLKSIHSDAYILPKIEVFGKHERKLCYMDQ